MVEHRSGVHPKHCEKTEHTHKDLDRQESEPKIDLRFGGWRDSSETKNKGIHHSMHRQYIYGREKDKTSTHIK